MVLDSAVPLRSYNPVLDFTAEEIVLEREGGGGQGHTVGQRGG